MFINENTGWIVNGYGGRGRVYRTDDGGETWDRTFELAGSFFRSVTFADADRGWIGGLFNDGNVLFETHDGGHSWSNITNRLKSPPDGICAIQAIGDQTVYGVGAFSGGPWFVSTRNGGASWSNSLPGTEARTLVDLFFKNEEEGFAVGGTANIGAQLRGDAVVLRTTDGGASWTTVHRTNRGDGVAGEWAWKISFPSELVGYVSIEYTGNVEQQAAKYLKTVDGGISWSEHFIPESTEPAGLQGIGFVTENVGWASGRGTTTMTTDGGATWSRISDFFHPDDQPDGGLDGRTNRIFVLGEHLAFAVGRYVYRFDDADGTYTPPVPSDVAPRTFAIEQNYPNPFGASTTIRYEVFAAVPVRIAVFDVLGRRVRSLVDAFQAPGAYRIDWDGTDTRGRRVAPGAYLYLMDIGDGIEMKRAVVLPE